MTLIIRGSDTPGLCLIGLGTVYIAPKILVLVSVLTWQPNDTSTRILGAIYTVLKPIRHNPGVSLSLIISGHGFCGHPWLSRSEESPFSLSAREGLTLVLGFFKLYILYPSQ